MMADPVGAGGGGAGAAGATDNQQGKSSEAAQEFSGELQNTGAGEPRPVRITSSPENKTSTFRDAATGEVLPEPKVPERLSVDEVLKKFPNISPETIQWLQQKPVGLYEQSTLMTFDPMREMPLKNFGHHIVVKGDTMGDIAQRSGVDLQALIKLNQHIKDPDVIHPGEIIFLKTPTPVKAQP